jgi:hypothetical protein
MRAAASRLAVAGVQQITVRNPQFSGRGGGTSSPALELVVTNPLPSFTSLAPAFLVAGANATGASLTLNGADFMPVSFVEISVGGGVFERLPSTYQTARQLSVTLPASLLEQPTVLVFRVVSPAVNNLGGGTSAERTLVVRAPLPTLAALTPSTATLASSAANVAITLTGTGFVTTSTVRIDGVATTTAYVSPTELRISLTIGVGAGLRPADTYLLSVNNPSVNSQGGGTSENRTFTVLNGVPVLTAVSPATTSATGSTFDAVLTGENFSTTSRVLYNGALLTLANVAFISPTRLQSTLPAAPIAVTTHTLSVVNAAISGQGGGISASVNLGIVYPEPQISSLAPVSTNATAQDWTLTVRGSFFAPVSVVRVNGVAMTTIYANSTTLRALLPGSFTRNATYYTVDVQTPSAPAASGGGTTATLTFSVDNPVPALFALSPTGVRAGTDATLTLTGASFATNASVELKESTAPVWTTLASVNVNILSSSSMTVNVTGALIELRGTYWVRVVNPEPAGGRSVNRFLTVSSASLAGVEFVGITTSVITAGSADPFSVRFRDSFSNLVDADIPFVRFSDETGSSTGTIALRRYSRGVSTATTTIFTVDGTYKLWVDGIANTSGNTTLVVQTNVDFRARFENIQPAITAGTSLPTFRLTYRDRVGNLTDRGVGDVTLHRTLPTNWRTLTIAMNRISEGVYESQPFGYTTSGTYFVRVAGITLVNTSFLTSTNALVDGTPPSFDVVPASPVVEFRNVDRTLTAGGSQTILVTEVRDRFGNDIPSAETMTVTFSNTTTATGGIRASTGSITLTKRAGQLNVYDAPDTRFEWQGAYTLEAAGYTEFAGNRQFVVNPTTVRSAEFQGVPESIAVNAALPAFTVTFRDRFLNLTDHAGAVMLRNTTDASITGIIPTEPSSFGVVVFTSQRFGLAGNFILSVGGIPFGNTLGTRNFTVLRNGNEITDNGRCGTIWLDDSLLDPETIVRRNEIEATVQQYQQEELGQNMRASRSSLIPADPRNLTIPVVFHIVQTNGMPFISDADVCDQLRVLNEDFNRTNADATNTLNIFQPIAAGMTVRFVLANRTPAGAVTTGILRTTLNRGRFNSLSGNDELLFKETSPAFDVEQYLNVWVVDAPSGDWGLGYFPSAQKAVLNNARRLITVDGVNINNKAFGSLGTYLDSRLNRGRTLTHEVGHWLNLRHIWGDRRLREPLECKTDFVDDTPPQVFHNDSRCPSGNYITEIPHPFLLFFTRDESVKCSGNPYPSDMYMNYMDYTNDACMNMFSQGQVNRMNATIWKKGGARRSLWGSQGFAPLNVDIQGDDKVFAGSNGRYRAVLTNDNGLTLYRWEYRSQDAMNSFSPWQLVQDFSTFDEISIAMQPEYKGLEVRLTVTTNFCSTQQTAFAFFSSEKVPIEGTSSARKITDNTLSAQSKNQFNINLLVSPNPTAGNTDLAYTLPEPGYVRVEVTSPMQTLIINVASDLYQEKGQHHIPISTKQLLPGVYAIRLKFVGLSGENIQQSTSFIFIR